MGKLVDEPCLPEGDSKGKTGDRNMTRSEMGQMGLLPKSSRKVVSTKAKCQVVDQPAIEAQNARGGGGAVPCNVL